MESIPSFLNPAQIPVMNSVSILNKENIHDAITEVACIPGILLRPAIIFKV